MNKRQRKRLVRLIDKLEALPEEKLNMNTWTSISVSVMNGRPHAAITKDLRGCGTTACLAGWLPVWFPRTWAWSSYYYLPVLKNYEWRPVPVAMTQYFGGTRMQWAKIIHMPTKDMRRTAIKAAVITAVKDILHHNHL